MNKYKIQIYYSELDRILWVLDEILDASGNIIDVETMDFEEYAKIYTKKEAEWLATYLRQKVKNMKIKVYQMK